MNIMTGYFRVPKVMDEENLVLNIRAVYDATKCGLNKALWAPNFYLPKVDTTLRMIDSTSWFSDLDFDDFFLNYFLDRRL